MTAQLSMTMTATMDARALGFSTAEVIATIASIERKHFVKSMTTHDNYKEWQDVYNVPVPAKHLVIYTKFRADTVTEFRIMSFKEK